MQTRDTLGFFLIPLVLLAAAWAINGFALWSFLGNLTVPWLCTALALAVLIVGTTCLLTQCPPAHIPRLHATVVIAAVLVILGAGMVIDLLAYGETADWLASLGEWVGFAVILGGAFWLPSRSLPPVPSSS